MERRGRVEYPERDEIDLVEVLQALGDPVRLQIVRMLDAARRRDRVWRDPDPGEQVDREPPPQGAARGRRRHAQVEGTRRYYTLRRDDLEARFPGLLDSVLRNGERQPV